MSPWVTIVANYGLPFAIELAKLIAEKKDPTADDFRELGRKYGHIDLDAKIAALKDSPGLQ